MNQHWPAGDPACHTTCDELMNEWVVVNNTRENAGISVHDHQLLDMHTAVYSHIRAASFQLRYLLLIISFLFIFLCLSIIRITYTYTVNL